MKKLLAAFSAAALLATPAMLEARDFDPVPRLILRPHGGQIVKSRRIGEDKYKVEYFLRRGRIRDLADEARSNAENNGFRTVKAKVSPSKATLEFRRGPQEMDIRIKEKGTGGISYEAELDLNRDKMSEMPMPAEQAEQE